MIQKVNYTNRPPDEVYPGWYKHEFDGYDNLILQADWIALEERVVKWCDEHEGKGRYNFDDSFGYFRFECEEDYMVFLLKFGHDIRNVV